MTKLANCPMPPVFEPVIKSNRFFISEIKIPATGPMTSAPINPGKSLTSSARKDGKIGKRRSNCISIKPITPSSEMRTIVTVDILFFIIAP